MKINRRKIFVKYDSHCAYCGVWIEYKTFQVDHILPKVMGGTDEESNLNPSCRECNLYKNGNDIELFRAYLRDMFFIDYRLFKSKNKRKLALRYKVIHIIQWDGLFYYEKINKEK